MKKPKYLLVTILSLSLLLGACANQDGAGAGTDTGNNNAISGNTSNHQEDESNGNAAKDQGSVEEEHEAVGEDEPQPPTSEAGEEGAAPAEGSAAEILDYMLEQVEQPPLMELNDEELEAMYGLDPALLEDYVVRMPMMNVKTNEIAILKVKDAQDIPAVEESIEQRAKDVQKQFEHYLPDQYENAKNYQVAVEGNMILFVISESADELIEVFRSMM